MTPSQKRTIQIQNYIEETYGIHPDRWGNIKIVVINGFIYRFKFTKIVIRLESLHGKTWMRHMSFNIKNVADQLTETGLLPITLRGICIAERSLQD